jgi:hypothetical protein
MQRPTLEDAGRFYQRVERGRRCWLWTGGTRKGYGAFSLGGKTYGAHRVAFVMAYGYDPRGKKLLHSCDNTLCVNPRHLIVGSQGDNVDDMLVKNRHAYGNRNGARRHPERVARGERSGAAKLCDADVQRIRELRAGGMSVTELASRWGVDKSTISRLTTGKQWKHL